MAHEHEAFEIAEVSVIKHGKITWIPDVKIINDRKFIALNKWNRDFVRFVMGKSLDMRNTQLNQVNSEFFDSLLAARKKASIQAVVDALDCEEKPGQVADTLDKPSNGRRARMSQKPPVWSWATLCSSEPLATPIVTITVQGYSMDVKTDLRSNVLWVELLTENIAFIQAGVQSSPEGRRYKRKRGGGDGVPDETERDEITASEHCS
jgi:hypothetical protein